MIKISMQEQDGKMVVGLDGRLDTSATPDAEKTMEPLFHCDDKDIVFDCMELVYISSSGLRLLLEILKNSRAHGHDVYMKNLSKNIREAFELTGFIDLFKYV